MKIAAFDIGGTSVKYGLYEQKKLTQKSAFSTPQTFAELQQKMQQVISDYDEDVIGIAISAPGAVNMEKGEIEGMSAVPYLHHFPIVDALEAYFDLPVIIENDANCAGLCEMAMGVGKDYKHAAFIVLGTGVGGAIFINRTLYKGAHLFGGEFGFMKNEVAHTASYDATVVRATKRYTHAKEAVDGKLLFARAAAGDALAQRLLADMYDRIVALIYNLQVSLDPEIVVLGGGVSERPEFTAEIINRARENFENLGLLAIMPHIKACHYANDANLLGAALNFEKSSTRKY